MNQIKYQVKILDYIIYIFLFLYLTVDTFAGILISRGLPNIGQVYKLFLVFLMMISVLVKRYENAQILSFLFILLSFTLLVSFNSLFASFSQTLMVIFKIISVYIFYLYFENENDSERINKVFKINLYIFILNIFLGSLGFGRSTYSVGLENGIGTTGFFYAGNEVSYTFICLMYWFINNSRLKKKYVYVLVMVLAVLIGTKACMLGAILLCFIDIYYSAKPRNRKYIFLLLIILSIVLVFGVYIFMQDNPLYKFIKYKLKQQSQGTFPILNALLSGRILKIPIINEIYESKFNISTLLFGLGFPLELHRIEMDFVEIFYYFGVLLLQFEVIFYFKLLYISYKIENKKLFLFNVICILISFLAGHVVYSLMGGIFFSMLNTQRCIIMEE